MINDAFLFRRDHHGVQENRLEILRIFFQRNNTNWHSYIFVCSKKIFFLNKGFIPPPSRPGPLFVGADTRRRWEQAVREQLVQHLSSKNHLIFSPFMSFFPPYHSFLEKQRPLFFYQLIPTECPVLSIHGWAVSSQLPVTELAIAVEM